MPLFAVTAFTPESRAVRQLVQAGSRDAAGALVRRQGLFPTEIREKRSFFSAPSRLRLSRRELVDLFVHMEMQLAGDIKVVEAVNALKDSLPSPKLKYVLREVYDQLTTSKANLTNSFRLFPRSFPPDVLTVIEAGEETASLPERFAELRDRLEFTNALRETITRALQYPLFVTLIGCGLITFFMGRIVPQLSQILRELNAELPLFTQRVIAVSDWFGAFWLPLLVALVAVPAGYIFARRWPRFAMIADTLALRVVFFGSIYRQLSCALIARIYRSLYLAGKSPHEILDLCSTLVNNLALRSSLRSMKRHITEGATIAQAFGRAGVFPPEACAIVASGEEGSHLDKALHRIATFYSEEGRRRITGMAAWIGPVAIIILAVFVGIVLVAMFLPFFNLIKVVR